MSLSSVPEALRVFGPATLVVRAAAAVADVLGTDGLSPYATGDDAVTAAVAAPDGAVREAAAALMLDDTARRILEVGVAIDGADRALARRVSPEDAHGPQAEDAALKLLMLGWLAGAVSGDDTGDDASLAGLPSGPAAIALWAAVDVALPLGGADVAGMLEQQRERQSIQLVALCGEAGMDRVTAGVQAILDDAQRAVDDAAAHTEALALALAPFVPGLLASGDGAARQIALQTDRLPLYKWITARIAAEHAAVRAARGERP